MESPFGVSVHVPFCAVRCGYCDFTTYTSAELGGGGDRAAYARWAAADIALARRALSEMGRAGRNAGTEMGEREVSTVFFGGGTPTVLPVRALETVLDAIRAAWPVAADAEITVEANPDSVSGPAVRELAAAGVTRLSLGMQSAVPQVLATLERTHRPAHIPRAVDAAHAAGLEASVDLIYGTPGETLADWEMSLQTAVGTGIGHISVYALTLEPHTRLARRIAQGKVPRLEADDQAAKYELADAFLAAEGFAWYEISNYARDPGARCRHNLGYWRGGEWWGIGPGAHSALTSPAPVRWWNVKHPRAWSERLAAGRSPEAGRDTPDAASQMIERVMLGIRLAEGLDLASVPAGGRAAIAGLVADGLVVGDVATRGRLVLTLRGRLLTDLVTRALIA